MKKYFLQSTDENASLNLDKFETLEEAKTQMLREYEVYKDDYDDDDIFVDRQDDNYCYVELIDSNEYKCWKITEMEI